VILDDAFRAILRDEVRAAVRDEMSVLVNQLRGRSDQVGEFMRVAAAASLADINPATIREWIRRGELPGYGTKRTLRVKKSEFMALLSHGSLRPDNPPNVEDENIKKQALAILETRSKRGRQSK
jgi:excisionase family DNA binding protein